MARKTSAQRPTPLTVVMPWHLAVALEARTAHQRHVERTWWEMKQAWAHSASTAAERRERAGAIRSERARRRASGEYLGSRNAIMAAELEAELDSRGWLTRRWRPIPDGAASVPGRPWGRTDLPHRGTERVALELPPHLVRVLRRACYWVSRPAVTRLMDAADGAASSAAQSGDVVVTTGDVLRAAAVRAASGYWPPDSGEDPGASVLLR